MVTLDQIRVETAPDLYPREVLEGCESALVLFAAAWLGKQDAIHIADAGLTATCVDLDAKKLGEMALAYPEGWEYVHGDVFEYAETTRRRWDVVSLDPSTNLFDRCAALIALWCSLARKAVILGHGGQATTTPLPADWRLTASLHRSNFRGGVYWAVLEPA